MGILTQFFESGLFSLIFAISLRGLGGFTKWGAVLLTAGTSGGALIPAVMSPIVLSHGVRYAFVVVVASFAFGTIMPLYISLVPAVKKQVDPGRVIPRQASPDDQETQQTPSKRASRVLHSMVRKPKRAGSEATASTDRPSIEHVEAAQRASRQSGGGMDLAPWPD